MIVLIFCTLKNFLLFMISVVIAWHYRYRQPSVFTSPRKIFLVANLGKNVTGIIQLERTNANGKFARTTYTHRYISSPFQWSLSPQIFFKHNIFETMSCFKMPKWTTPCPKCVQYDVDLHIMNSLTRKKDKFITIDGNRKVRWYM